MLRATATARPARPPFADVVTLDHDGRHRRRIRLTAEGGHDILLDLPDVPDLRDGDGIVLEDGRHVLVRAAREPLMDIHAGDPAHLARIAWHIGNRHLAAEIAPGRIRIRADHVIAAMVEGLGGHVHPVSAPFNPEGGAYGGAAPTHHGHHHGHHHHGHGHDHR